jgi:hypothetical protein
LADALMVSVDGVLGAAVAHVGFRGLGFARSVGYESEPWSGAFVESVFRECNVLVHPSSRPSFVSPVDALLWFERRARVFRKPKRGDVVFFSNGSTTASVLSVGFVTGVPGRRGDGAVLAVCGGASSGLPRGPQDADGVYVRFVFASEVVGFGRLRWRGLSVGGESSPVIPVNPVNRLSTSHIMASRRSGEKFSSIKLVQRALFFALGESEFTAGVLDVKTRRALAVFSRLCGVLDNPAGDPRQDILDKLGSDSGLW